MPPPPPDFAPAGTHLPAPHLPGSPTPAVVAPPLPPTLAPVPSPIAPLPHLGLEPWPIRRQPCLSLEMRGGLAPRSTHGLPPVIPSFFQGLRGRREKEDGGGGSAINPTLRLFLFLLLLCCADKMTNHTSKYFSDDGSLLYLPGCFV